MAENYDLSAIAGEYVLGTLDSMERAFVEKERKQNPKLEEEIEFWEAGLFPLTDSIMPLDPSLQLWNRLEPRLIAAHKQKPVTIYVAPAPPVPDHLLPPPVRLAQADPAQQSQASSGAWKLLAIFSICVALIATVYCAALIKLAGAPLNPLKLLERVLNADALPDR